MKTSLRAAITLALLMLLSAAEIYLHGDTPAKFLLTMPQPHPAITVEVYLLILGALFLLSGVLMFRALAGFRFSLNKMVFVYALSIPAVFIGMHAVLMFTTAVWLYTILLTLTAAVSFLGIIRSFRMDVWSGLIATATTLLTVALAVWSILVQL
jgi:hypothetical protein